jgi:hypothetical protein
MQFSLTLPHPLARLTRILEDVERRRAEVGPRPLDRRTSTDQDDSPAGGPGTDPHRDLGSLSISRHATPLEGADDGLEFLSLSRLEGASRGRRDSLENLSLTRRFPPIPGP